MSTAPAIEAIAARQHGVLTAAQALANGMTRRQINNRVSTGRWCAVERGVFVVAGSADTRERRLVIALLGTGPTALLSHATAGALFGVCEHTTVVHITIPHGQHLDAGPGRIVHQARRLTRRDLTKIGVLPATAPNRTFVDLAGLLSPSAFEAALDTALMKRLVTIEGLLEYTNARSNKGLGQLRRLVIDRRDGVPQEEMEREFKRLVRRFGLPKPKLQHPFGDNKRIDAAYPELKVAIELDSWRYHGSLLAFRADRPRQNVLELDGWMVLRFTWDAIKYRPDEVAETLVTALGRRATTPAPPTRVRRIRGSG